MTGPSFGGRYQRELIGCLIPLSVVDNAEDDWNTDGRGILGKRRDSTHHRGIPYHTETIELVVLQETAPAVLQGRFPGDEPVTVLEGAERERAERTSVDDIAVSRCGGAARARLSRRAPECQDR